MKSIFPYWCLFCLISVSAIAQNKSAKVYSATITTANTSTDFKQLKRQNDEIAFQAKNKIKNLLDLYNALSNSENTESERNSIIQNSYLPNPNQLFYDDRVSVDDDVDPNHTTSANTAEVLVDRYLRNFDLFYTKTDTSTVSFSRVIPSPVQQGKDYLYIKVFFTETFTSKHSQIDIPYAPMERVAELRAESVAGKWRVFITRLAFVRPGEGMVEIAKPVIAKETGPEKAISGPQALFRRAGSSGDSLTVAWDARWLNVRRSSLDMVPAGFYQRSGTDRKSQTSVTITLLKKDQKLSFRRIDGEVIEFNRVLVLDPLANARRKRAQRVFGWSEIATGLIGLGVSYVGYASLQDSYQGYTNKLTGINAEYAIWQTLTQQPTGNALTAISFNEYASPGIYAVYGGGVAGGGLLMDGVRRLLRAGKMKRSTK